MLDIRHFIVDPDDGDPRFHLAAFDGDRIMLEQLLSDPELRHNIDRRIRPYGATPIRLAATSGHASCIQCLIDWNAKVDKVDVKGQTPLFVAVQKKHVDCVKLLLENEANPNGSDRNRSSPLFIAAEHGSLECVKLLLKFGANTEQPYINLPAGFPLHISATYHHYDCYVTLLLAGAEPNLCYVQPPLSASIIAHASLAHLLVRHCCPVKFAKCFIEFGGNVWQLDSQGQLASDLPQGGECKSFFQYIIGQPLSLQSLCRIKIRRYLGRKRLGRIHELPLPSPVINYLLFNSDQLL